jgi:DNA adenine methylase
MALKPFLKWAGGKDKLFNQLENLLPNEIGNGVIKNYYEPFLGSGAVFFNLVNRYPLDNIVLSDINEELILAYKVVKYDVAELMQMLHQLQRKYLKLSEIDKEKFYYDLRSTYNSFRSNC